MLRLIIGIEGRLRRRAVALRVVFLFAGAFLLAVVFLRVFLAVVFLAVLRFVVFLVVVVFFFVLLFAINPLPWVKKRLQIHILTM